MPTLSENRWLRLATLCVLYLAQGMPWGFVNYTLAAYLAGQGLSTAEVGLAMGLSTAPWTFKFLWGPVIDRFQLPSMGRRRPWILGAQFLMAATIFTMLAIPDLAVGVGTLGAMVFVHNIFASLQDVAVDALAVDLLPESERGTANGLMYGSKYLGGAVGGAGLATVLKHSGIEATIAAQGLLLLVVFFLPLVFRERPGDRFLPRLGATPRSADEPAPAHESTDMKAIFALLFRVFRLRSNQLGVGLALLTNIGAGALGVIATVFYVQHLGWADTDFARFAGGPALVCGLVGAIAGGVLADKLGRKKVIAFATIGLGLTWVLFSVAEPFWADRAVVKGFLLAEPVFQSLMSGALFALFMDLSLPAVAATQFTAYMSLLNLGTTAGQMLSGIVKGWVGTNYAEMFLVAGLVQMSAALVLVGIDPHETRRVLGGPVAADNPAHPIS